MTTLDRRLAYKRRNPLIRKAHDAIHNLWRTGRMLLYTRCQICMEEDDLQYHHIDYEKGEGLLICKDCHTQEHLERAFDPVWRGM